MGDLANEWRPLCVVPASPIEGGVAFHFPTEVVQVLDAPDVVWAVVRESSGSRVASDVARAVAAEVPIAVESALAVLDELREHNIVLDAESVYLPFHALTKNPQPFPSIKPYPQSCAADNGGFTHVDIPRNGSDTPLAFARRRRSCRSFTEQRISSTLILTIATDSLGFEHQIPSAGNLHPLRLDVVVFRGDESLPRGVYSYSPEQASLLDRHRELELDVFRHALNSEELVFGAPVVMVISACFRRTTWKYGNRGYRFVLLEAGQAAQNILLSATALGIASVEYGGFLDGALRDALGLVEFEPIIAIGLGNERVPSAASAIQRNAEAVDETFALLFDRSVRVQTGTKMGDDGRPSDFFVGHVIAPQSPLSASETLGTGAGRSSLLAEMRAKAEAVERLACGHQIFHVHSTAEALGCKWADPREFTPYSTSQLATLSELDAFTEDMELDWVRGSVVSTGETIFVPADLVFYPFRPVGRFPISYANSSGVAAGMTEARATRSAFLELVERDAIMRLWLTQLPPHRIPEDSLPKRLIKRIRYWESLGRRFVCLTPPSFAGTTVLVVAFSDSYPFFVCGAASDVQLETALCKAFLEAETILYSNIKARAREVLPASVRLPEDHFAYYANKGSADSVKWLLTGDDSDVLQGPMRSIKGWMRDASAVKIVLLDPSSGLRVVRILSPALIPISFGLGTEFYSHAALKGVGIAQNIVGSVPHFFA